MIISVRESTLILTFERNNILKKRDIETKNVIFAMSDRRNDWANIRKRFLLLF